MNTNLGTIAFYNVENFYADRTLKEETFLPSNFSKWKEKRYHLKVDKISFAIAKIGKRDTDQLPLLVGLAEVENNFVLEDLINHTNLKEGNYDYILHESLDERNINVGCIYRKDLITINKSEPIRIVFKNQLGEKSYTRDILYLEADLSGETIYFFIVHLPSKIDKELNQMKRKILLTKIKSRVDELLSENPKAKIMVMGDFNDTPSNDDLREILDTRSKKHEIIHHELFNPMVELMNYKRGSLVHQKQWMLFDQMLFSKEFLTSKNAIEHLKTDIFDASFLTTNVAKYGAFPHRSFIGSKYLGGYSDHFPIYTIIKY
ncbi:endonuclease/exonuclease/phosphatase family protein [Faecalibacter rhinopitheci]|uniref:Endonuclease/exonuclease/phosphatase domain-containing protein n=1 Tax=Faecalibacter rhinopitheci TaxID=2779678 RepID=A0A8J7FSQ2_9FLAO|nr:hypothetical protein [Faecalibacter rhinopitheci]MBF0596967.1 hypothetical protein [Faecalibacter rhinopitheci]MBQ0148428.1 hypothetical protein [Candidatus Onthonaster equi]